MLMVYNSEKSKAQSMILVYLRKRGGFYPCQTIMYCTVHTYGTKTNVKEDMLYIAYVVAKIDIQKKSNLTMCTSMVIIRCHYPLIPSHNAIVIYIRYYVWCTYKYEQPKTNLHIFCLFLYFPCEQIPTCNVNNFFVVSTHLSLDTLSTIYLENIQ